MKRIFAVLLIVAMTLSLCACGRGKDDEDSGPRLTPIQDRGTESEENKEEKEEEEPQDREDVTQESTQAPTEPTASVEDQLTFLVANRDTWMQHYSWPTIYYTVADLDQNGCLEIMVAETFGTGSNSYYNIWEVSRDCTELIHTNDFDREVFQSDIIKDLMDVYYNRDTDTYFYLVSDYERNGWAYNCTRVRGMSLKNGRIEECPVCYEVCETGDDYVSVTTYYDNGYNTLSIETFETFPDEYFANCEKLQATFEWVNVYLGADQVISDEEVLANLQNALACFYLS
ncbi:MAG: hypothetical protein IKT58_04130 [Oscillospiraceae bacterium]|nr:hypothetical protein [Oscillospiraceae bacterium]